MINFRNTQFIKSVSTTLEFPEKKLPEILFVGRSNVGKSSLLNAITNNSKLAYTSSNPGHTTLLNYFNCDKTFYLVDSPGYGYTASGSRDLGQFQTLMEGYFSSSLNVKGAIFLIDSRRIPNEDDILMINYLKEYHVPFIIVATKCDKVTQKELAKIKANQSTLNVPLDDILLFSIKNTKSMENLRFHIAK